MNCPKSIMENAGKLNLTMAEILRALYKANTLSDQELTNAMADILLLWDGSHSALQEISSAFKEIYNRQIGA